VTHLTDPLTVYESPLHISRVGRANDGGYVIADRLGYDAFLSGGIADDDSFEHGILALYPEILCAAFDPSVGDVPRPHQRLAFVRRDAPPLIGTARNALVKLDIEGGEWEWLAASDLGHVAQLVVELHSPHLGLWSWPALARLAESHALIHAHGNNWDGIVDIEGVRVPGTLETTWVRRDLAGDLRRNTRRIPGPLDMPNVPGRADYVIDWAPFVWSQA
jgi:hypothetical protein